MHTINFRGFSPVKTDIIFFELLDMFGYFPTIVGMDTFHSKLFANSRDRRAEGANQKLN